MNRQVLQPFRAPRNRGDTTQARVHRKDNSARFKEMERWMDRNVTGEDMDRGPPTTQLAITTTTKDTIAISGSNMASPTTTVPIVSDGVSPCISEYESEGFLSRRKAVSKRKQAQMEIFKTAKKFKGNATDNSDDDVPVSALLKRKQASSSDVEDDNLPIASLVVSKKLDILANVSSAHVHPTGEACVGLGVARDFGPPHGVCIGSVVSVDTSTSCPLSCPLWRRG
jgi:hypothetical protein